MRLFLKPISVLRSYESKTMFIIRRHDSYYLTVFQLSIFSSFYLNSLLWTLLSKHRKNFYNSMHQICLKKQKNFYYQIFKEAIFFSILKYGSDNTSKVCNKYLKMILRPKFPIISNKNIIRNWTKIKPINQLLNYTYVFKILWESNIPVKITEEMETQVSYYHTSYVIKHNS